MTKDWSAIILAGGKGTRLMPLTSEVPKPLVPVTNVCMVDYAIAHLIYAGIDHIILALAYMGEKLQDYINETWTEEKLGDVRLDTHIQDSKGTADAYRLLRDDLDSENVVVSMADIVTNLPMRDFMDFHEEKGGIATISMKPVESHTSQYGVVQLDSDRKIHLFLEKPGPMELYVSSMSQQEDIYMHTNIINTGIYCFKNEVGEVLMDNPNIMDFGGELFPYFLDNQFDLYGFVRDYYWLDCGNPQTYLWANWDLLRKYAWPITPNGQEYDGIFVMGVINSGSDVTIEKPTCFGEYVYLDDGVRVKQLSSVGNKVNVGKRTLIQKSVIWDRVEIGSGCKISDSIISNDCEVGDDVVLEKAIIAPKCKVSDGTHLRDETLELGEQV